KKANYILDADIRSFFDSVSQSWLVRFLEHRIADPRIIRLVLKWLKAGVLLKRKTRRDRMCVKLKEIKEELRKRMHQPIPEQGAWLKQVVTGFYNYHAVPTNAHALSHSAMRSSDAGSKRWGVAVKTVTSPGRG